MSFESNSIGNRSRYDYYYYLPPCLSTKHTGNGKAFSLFYNDLARWLFITLTFTGILSTGWFGIPLAPQYFLHSEIDIIAGLFALFSALGTIWGIMAYREFTNSGTLVKDARDLARRIDPMIGDYQYRSYNPETREYENGYVPLGPIDFWDKETQVPAWLDKGKYWHILLGLQTPNKEIALQVVRDRDLPFLEDPRNVAVTFREIINTESRSEKRKNLQKKYRYRVKVPQWLVMNTDYSRLASQKDRLKSDDLELSIIMIELNEKLGFAAEEIIEREKPRIRYPWRVSGVGIYLNKSLPIRIIYKELIRHFPVAKKRTIDYTNENLANIKDEQLIASIIDVATDKEIPTDRLDKFLILVSFLRNEYARHGIGEGSSKYHNFHHSLEVTYMSLQMLPKEFHGYTVSWKDYEFLMLAGILHDYDPSQLLIGSTDNHKNNGSVQPKGPKVSRTIDEINKTRILDAYFTMNRIEFQNYFREYKSSLLLPIEFSTTHPEYVKVDWKPTESLVVETLIWRTDFPFFKQRAAQKMFDQHMTHLEKKGYDPNKLRLLGEVLWLADLSVTYMGSDPIRAWDRVSKLYDELYLPRFEAVSRTDAFFSAFADNDLFKELIHMRHFPNILRQRWNLIYQFFHEGNPSTQLNRTISNARRLYLKVNLDIGMRDCEMLQAIASSNWSEYFIGIGKDQNEVLRAKSKFANLDPQNASSFWGDTMKLVPNIQDKSIDNFLFVLPKNSVSLGIMEQKLLLTSLLSTLKTKLVSDRSTIQILTDIDEGSTNFKDLLMIISDTTFQLGDSEKVYFPKDWSEEALHEGRNIQVLILHPKKDTNKQ